MYKDEYRVTNPFNILDVHQIFSKEHFAELLAEMVEDYGWSLATGFNVFRKNVVPSTMWKYRNIFEDNGFIEKKDIVLNPGMKIKVTTRYDEVEYRVCKIDIGRLSLISTITWCSFISGGFNEGYTFEELKSEYSGKYCDSLVLEE